MLKEIIAHTIPYLDKSRQQFATKKPKTRKRAATSKQNLSCKLKPIAKTKHV